MAVKSVFKQEPGAKKQKKQRAKDSGMKPLAKQYITENPDKEGSSHFVFQARLTPKGFLMLMCKEFTLMFPGGMTEASTLLDTIFPGLHGKKGNRLVVVLTSSNRFGGYLATDDEHQCYYSFDPEEEILITATEPITETQEKKQGTLTLDDFGIDIKS